MNSKNSRYIQIQLQNKQTSYNKAYFASKNELLTWASKLLDLELSTLEEMGTGAIFCQLLDACHPGTVKLNKVNWKANSETDYISNFKIFQQGLIANDINKPIDINRLSKGKQYDLNELLQWIYGYYLNSKDDLREIYNAKKKRGGQNFIFNNKKNDLKKKYRKKQIIRNNSKDNDNLTQISTASCNLSNTSSNYNDNNYRNNYNNFNVSNLRQNLRNNNYHYDVNNKSKNRYEDTRYRNKSKQETKNKKYYQYEERILNNNNNIFTQNKLSRNINDNINTYNNNIYNTMNRCSSNDIINNNILSSSSKRNFKNIFEKIPSDYPNYNYQEDELNHDLENDLENEFDMTDIIGLNEKEMKNLINQEKKDGNKIKDLKNIIRKLRTNIISKEKELTNLKNAMSEEYKLKNFYLNKLKDIEYLYFNPIIKNTNENKNTILRQLLCSNQDTTIILDEYNYAYLRNAINNESVINNNKSIMLSNKKSKSNKKIEHINQLDNDIIMENKILNNINERRNEANMVDSMYMNNNTKNNNDNKSNKLNYSSRKNYNDKYIDDLFDSFNDISKIENNNNNNYYDVQQKKIIPIKLIQNESKLTQMSSYQNYNLSNSTYNINNNIKMINDTKQNENTNINYQKDNGKTNYYNNEKKYLAYSEKKKENVNNEQKSRISNKTEFKNYNLYSDISSILLNDSLHIPNI